MISNRMLLGSAVAVAFVGVVLSWTALATAQSEYVTEDDRLRDLLADIRELEFLRASTARAQDAEPAEADLLGAVRETIRRAGLDGNAFRGLATSGSEAIRGREGYRRTAYRLELGGLDAVDLGGFLAIWSESQPLWSVSRIELRREARSNRRTRGSVMSGYAVSMTLETVYAADAAIDQDR